MQKLITALGLAASVTATTALADQPVPWPNWYVGLSGGVTFLDETDISGTATGEIDFDKGGIGTIALGYVPRVRFQPLSNMRIEAEFGYHYNSVDDVNGSQVASNTQVFSYMGNLYYDLRTSSYWTPYVGGGAGVATVNTNDNLGLGLIKDRDNVFAYQFMAGISYATPSLPMSEWSLGYRYFTAKSPEFRTAGGRVEMDDLTMHSAEVGAKFRF